MSELIQIHWTCSSLDEARLVARTLVQKRLVACANIIPWVESIFSWEDEIDTQQESLVIFKTRIDLFEKVRDEILIHSSYEVPEILALPIHDGNQAYLDWVMDMTGARA